MPETPTKQALLAAINTDTGSTTIELSAATGIERIHANKTLAQMQRDGLVRGLIHLSTVRWRLNAIPESECDNQDLINS